MDALIKGINKSYGTHIQNKEQITNKLYRLDDGYRIYALKKSSLTRKTISMWEHVYQQAHSSELTEILPVYLTKQSTLFKEHNQKLYYLSPWNDEKHPTIEVFYRSIGRIHKETKQKQPIIDDGEIIRQFQQYQRYAQDAQTKLLSYIEAFEKQRYMSPFELQVCTHYRDIELVLKKMDERIEQFLEEIKQSEWNHSLCHGHLAFSHVFGETNVKIINWERAYIENAVLDLVVFFKNETVMYDAPIDSFIQSIPSYMEENKLTDGEFFLLLIHLLDPTSYFTIIQHYTSKTSERTMIQHVKHLEHAYRRLIFGLQLSNYFEDEYENILPDESED